MNFRSAFFGIWIFVAGCKANSVREFFTQPFILPTPTATPTPTPQVSPSPSATASPTPSPSASPPATVARYYLAPKNPPAGIPAGNDSNPGTLSQPFFTLEKLWTVVQPGDLVYLRGGTYAFEYEQYLVGRNGTSANPIKIFAYPGERPVFTAAPIYYQVANQQPNKYYQDLIFFSGNHVHWKGIEVKNFMPQDFGWRPFRVEDSQNNIFELLEIHHNFTGMAIRGASGGNVVVNSDFHHNQDPPPLGDYDGADGLVIGFVPAGQAQNIIRGCRAWYNADDGFDTWSNDSSVLIENSWAFYNGYISDTWNTAGNGSGFKLGMAAASTQLKRVVRHNIAFKNRMWGFVENNAVVQHQLYNNTAVLSGYHNYWFGPWGPTPGAFKNNISYRAGVAPYHTMSTAASVTHNSWNLTGALSDLDFQSLDPAPLVQNRKTDGSLPDLGTFLRPRSTSALRNAGTVVDLPYLGAKPDIGALEYLE